MKRLWGLVLALMVGAVALAGPGPFIRVEQTWDTGLVLQAGLINPLLEEPIGSINTAAMDLYVGKANPFVFEGWWTIGVGAWVLTNYAPNASIGGGIRFLFEVANSTVPGAAWCPYFEAGWWFGPFQVFGRFNYFYEISQVQPFGRPYLSFGFAIDLGVLRTGAK